MKEILLSVGLLVSGLTFGQTYSSGDKELDGSLMSINVEAKTNLPQIKTDWAKAYNTSVEKLDGLFKKGLAASDVFMTLELARITKKPIDIVVRSYEVNKKKGWGAIAKDLGIKPGSPEFHALKGTAKTRSANAKKKPEKKAVGKPAGKPAGKPVVKQKGKH